MNNIRLNYMTTKLYKKLKKEDKELIEKFLNENSNLSKNDFEYNLNRLFLDKKDKPKNWLNICEILSNHNSYI